jgi:hypothetical protein
MFATASSSLTWGFSLRERRGVLKPEPPSHPSKKMHHHLPQKRCIISTEAAHSLIVSSAVERPPHFAFAFSVACFLVVIPKGSAVYFAERPGGPILRSLMRRKWGPTHHTPLPNRCPSDPEQGSNGEELRICILKIENPAGVLSLKFAHRMCHPGRISNTDSALTLTLG